MSYEFYPAGPGLILYLLGSAYDVFGPNRFAEKSDAVEYASKAQDLFPKADCRVVDEYFPEAPDFRWRVLCSGK